MKIVWDGKDARRDCLFEPSLELQEQYGSDSVELEGLDRGQNGNVLILGDSKHVIAALLSQYKGKLDCIYIDPPFDVGSEMRVDVDLSLDKSKKSSIRIPAYRDSWGAGEASYASVMFERLALAYHLLSDTGSLFLHCDYRTTAMYRLMLDEIFGSDNHVNEIVWFYKTGGVPEKLGFGKKHDTIHYYVKDRKRAVWNPQKEKSYLQHRYGFSNIDILTDHRGDYCLVNCRDVFDISALRGNQPERENYPTQKPEALLERLILAVTNEGDIVADFFCGSGTTAAVAERLGRRFVVSDKGDYGVSCTKKRLLEQGCSARYGLSVYAIVPSDMSALAQVSDHFQEAALRYFSELKRGGESVRNVCPPENQLDKEYIENVLRNSAASNTRSQVFLAYSVVDGLSEQLNQICIDSGKTVSVVRVPWYADEPSSSSVSLISGLPHVRCKVVGSIEAGFDVAITHFQPVFWGNGAVKLSKEAVENPWLFLDFWGLDFTSNDGVFRPQWCAYRTRTRRELPMVSNYEFKGFVSGKGSVKVKIQDIFGTATVIELPIMAL